MQSEIFHIFLQNISDLHLLKKHTNLTIHHIKMNSRLTWIAGASMLLALTACVDDKYDLSNVDTTVKIPVNDLALPVNLEPVKLENLFNIDPDDPDCQVKVINGEYAVSENGHFESSAIEIERISMRHPQIAGSVNTLTPASAMGRSARAAQLSYNIRSEEREFTYESHQVSDFIKDVDAVTANLTFIMDIRFAELQGKVNKLEYSNMQIQLPKGLENVTVAGAESSYNKQTGIATVARYQSQGNTMRITVNATGVDITYLKSAGDASFTPAATEGGKGHIAMRGKMYLVGGTVTANAEDINSTAGSALPSQITMYVDYTLYDTEITNFSGKITYNISEVDIPDTELNDLPDILTQESTDLKLENPQIYLMITNPLSGYELTAVSGLQITSQRTGKPDHVFVLDNDLELDSKENPSGVFKFVLSPKNPTERLAGFEDAKWVLFSDFGDVLSGEGLPNRIKYDLVNPHVPTQEVKDFALGVSAGKVDGDYNLMAPLGMRQGSQIVYTEDFDGWNSGHLDYCTIERVNLTMTANSDVPVDIKLTGYPIDNEGNRIYDANGQPININGAIIPPNASNVPVNVYTTSTIPAGSKLNGIRFVATAASTEANSSPLRPDMEFILDNIHATVTGYYLKDLDD